MTIDERQNIRAKIRQAYASIKSYEELLDVVVTIDEEVFLLLKSRSVKDNFTHHSYGMLLLKSHESHVLWLLFQLLHYAAPRRLDYLKVEAIATDHSYYDLLITCLATCLKTKLPVHTYSFIFTVWYELSQKSEKDPR